MSDENFLVGDIGGTNARFALVNTEKTGYHDEMSLQCSDFPGVDQAIRFYLEQQGMPDPASICLAVAGPVIDQRVQLTNNPWVIEASQLSRDFPSASVELINDFTAIALSIPLLSNNDHQVIGHIKPKALDTEEINVGIIGPGTGLGISGLIKRHGHIIPITTEAGHMGFAPETPQQIELLQQLLKRWPRISNERLVSGAGLENIYWALNHLSGQPDTSLSAARIFQLALQEQDSLADESVQIFFEVLGQLAGDLALALNTKDGIYIAGGMVMRYPQLLENSRFRSAFENKGRHKVLMQDIPTSLITHPQPGLLGASYQVTLKLRQKWQYPLLG